MRFLAIPLLFAALFSDSLSPVPPDVQDLQQFYAPPSRIRFFDAQGSFHWRPFTYRAELVDPLDGRYRELKDQPHDLVLFCAGYPYRFLGLIPTTRHLIGTRAEGVFHPWGTDDLGRDVLARALAGARSSLLVLFTGIAAYFLIGVGIGGSAGMRGGWIDALLMRFSEFVLALPALYLVLAVRLILPPQMPAWQTVLITAGTIAAITWPPLARGVRGVILQVRNAGYVEASRSLGASRLHIFRRHLLPALTPFALAQTAVAAPVFILGEVILSFLNVGFHDSAVSWGTMLRNLRDPRVITDFWWNLAPLALVFITLLCLAGFSNRIRGKVPAQLA